MYAIHIIHTALLHSQGTPASTAHTCLQAFHPSPQSTSIYTAPKLYPSLWATTYLYCLTFTQSDLVYMAGPSLHSLNLLAWAPLVVRREKQRGIMKTALLIALALPGQGEPGDLDTLQIQLLGTALVGDSCWLFNTDRLIREWGISWASASCLKKLHPCGEQREDPFGKRHLSPALFSIPTADPPFLGESHPLDWQPLRTHTSVSMTPT